MSETNLEMEMNKAIKIVTEALNNPNLSEEIQNKLNDAFKKEELIKLCEDSIKKFVDVFNKIKYERFNQAELYNLKSVVEDDIKRYSGRFLSK